MTNMYIVIFRFQKTPKISAALIKDQYDLKDEQHQ